jgi:hypothetical protein
MKLYVYTEEGGVLVNTGGDTLTEDGSSGLFSCTVTEAVTSDVIYYVEIKSSGGTLLRLNGFVSFPTGDVVGVYRVNDPSLVPVLPAASFVNAYPTAAYTTDDILTYADLTYRLADKRGLDGTTRELMQLQISVADAYTQLTKEHAWNYYTRRIAFNTEATDTVVNAVYDVSSNTLTRSSGTWNVSAIRGEIVHANKRYGVYQRQSSTVLKLADASRPPADFTANVRWQQVSYVMPYQIRRMVSLTIDPDMIDVEHMELRNMARTKQQVRAVGNPIGYTEKPSEVFMGLFEIELTSVPAASIRLEATMAVLPRPLRVFEDTGVDGITTVNSRTFFSATANFRTKHVGCILRISGSASLPRGITQYAPDRVDFEHQVIITAIISSTSVTVSEALSESGTGLGYTISDPADINTASMLAPLEALAWQKFSYNYITGDPKQYSLATSIAKAELQRGQQADADMYVRATGPSSVPWYDLYANIGDVNVT